MDENGNFHIKTWDINRTAEKVELQSNVTDNGERLILTSETQITISPKLPPIKLDIEIDEYMDIVQEDKAEIGEMIYKMHFGSEF